MKKFFTLLAASLLFAGTTSADVTLPTITTDESNPTFYVIQNFRSQNYATYAGESTQLTQSSSKSSLATHWYFLAADGSTSADEGVYLVNAANTSVKLATTSSFTTDGAVWYISENAYNTGYVCVALTKGNTDSNCWDDQSGKIGYWKPSSSDYQGTSWTITEAQLDYTALNKAITFAGGIKENFSGDMSALETALSNANAIDQSTTTYTPEKQTQIDEATTNLVTAIRAFTLYSPTTPSATAPGMYFRLRSANLENGYLTCPAVGSTTPTVTVTETPGDETIWCWAYGTADQTGGTAGRFLLSYYGGMYMKINNSSSLTNASLQSTAYTGNTSMGFTLDEDSYYPGSYAVFNTVSGWNYMYSGTTDGNTPQYCKTGSLSNDKGYAWYIEPVDEIEVALNAAGGASYATLFLPVPATVDVQACNAQLNESKDALELTNITNIPARTPVVLYSSTGESKATVTLSTTNPTDTYTSDLTGTSIPVTWNSDNFALGSNAEVAGFYKWEGSQLNPNRAYLDATKVSASVRGLAFHFGDETTGINTAATPNATSGKVYDLQGRRVLNAQKGLYIVGGKKVLVK